MAIVASKVIAPYWFTPENQEEPVTRFQLKPLSAGNSAEVFSEFNVEKGGLTGAGMRLAIKHGLIGWEGFTNSKGEQLPFSAENVERLPPGAYLLLAMTIVADSILGEEELKN